MLALADAPVEEIEKIVRPCGLGNSKARDISACMKMIRDVYGGNVPESGASTLEEVQEATGAGTVCGACLEDVQRLVDYFVEQRDTP